MADVKKILKEVLERTRMEKEREGEERTKRNDADRSAILEGIGKDVAEALAPVLEKLPESARISEEQIRNALTEAIQVNMPELDTASIASSVRDALMEAVANIQIPAPQVSVNVPEVRVPQINIPPATITYPDRMKVEMDGVDNKRPLAVQMFGVDGKPFQFSMGAGGGGKADFFTVKGIQNTVGIVSINPDGSAASPGAVTVSEIFGTTGTGIVNADNRIKVSVETGGSGLTDAELRASSLVVDQLSGANWSTSVVDIFGSTATSGMINADNRLKVSVETGGSGLTDAELRAASLVVNQLSGASWSTAVIDIFGSTSASGIINADNRLKVELPAQTVTVASVTATVAANIVDSSGVAYSGTNPVPISDAGGTISIDGTLTGITNTIDVRQVSGASWSVAATIVGSSASTAVTGTVASDVADDGSPPVKNGGIARTANPTAVAAGDAVTYGADDLGRQLTRPFQVRDLTLTAYVSVTGGTETTLLAASAGSFHDCLMITGSNNSDAAVSVAIRAVTGGNVIHTMMIPANGMVGWAPAIPWPQDATGNNWTVDGPDETGRTLTFSGLFIREV